MIIRNGKFLALKRTDEKSDTWEIPGVVFLCEITSGEVQLSEEHKEFAWFDKDDWNRLYPAFAKIVNELDDSLFSD